MNASTIAAMPTLKIAWRTHSTVIRAACSGVPLVTEPYEVSVSGRLSCHIIMPTPTAIEYFPSAACPSTNSTMKMSIW